MKPFTLQVGGAQREHFLAWVLPQVREAKERRAAKREALRKVPPIRRDAVIVLRQVRVGVTHEQVLADWARAVLNDVTGIK